MHTIGHQIHELDTPVLWVDLEIMERNIQLLADFFSVAGVNWRPHTKGIKVPAIAHKAIEAGAIGVTCAKLSEAEVMAYAGIKDILIANQIVGSQKIQRLANLCRQVDVKIAVDNELNIAELGKIATQFNTEINVLVEVNTGMDRAGVPPGPETVRISQLIAETAGLCYKGLMAWEGHAVGIEDPQLKKQTVETAVSILKGTTEMCRDAGLSVEIVSGGGSGTYKITSHLSGITEIQAGGALFCDMSYQKWGVDTQPSIFVRSLVTSRPNPKRIIFDAGFKALPAWGERMPTPIGISGFESFKASAEHGVVTLNAPEKKIQIGDTFDFMLGYGDSTVFLHDILYGVRQNVVEVAWLIHGRGKTH